MSVKRREIVKLMVALFMCAGVLGSFGFGFEKKMWECRGCSRQHTSQDKPDLKLGGPCPKPFFQSNTQHYWVEVR